MEERQRQVAHGEDLDWAGLGDTFRSPWAPSRDAILQPPKPQITPSARIIQLAAEYEIEREAAE
jgi:hypothetical protein